MEKIKNYNFNNLARIRDDNPYISQRELDNKEYSDYNIYKFHDSISSADSFALSQPNVFISNVYGPAGDEPNVIDSDSYLKKSQLTNLNNKINLQPRQYLTVPYLGRVKCEPVVESMLRKGQFTNIPNSVGSISEETHNNIIPLVPSVKKTITNPKNLVEGVADPSWVRGGEMTRNYNYSFKEN